MKKKITTLLLMSALVLSLAACGNETSPDPIDTPESSTEDTAESEPTEESEEASSPEPSEEPSPEPSEEPSPEPSEEPSPEPAEEPATEVVDGLPEDRAWIDDLYNKLIAYDVAAVKEILHDPDLASKAEPYLYPEYAENEYEAGYKLYTTDYKMVGLIIEDGSCAFAFYSEHEDQGFESIKGGDILIGFEAYLKEYDIRSDGKTAIYDTDIYNLEPDKVFIEWHNGG